MLRKLTIGMKLSLIVFVFSTVLVGTAAYVLQDLRSTMFEERKAKLRALVEAAGSIYDFVLDVCTKLGASLDELVPFEEYAAAAQELSRPASAARALNNGAFNIERADKLVQLTARQFGMNHPILDQIVALVDRRLAANRRGKHAAA